MTQLIARTVVALTLLAGMAGAAIAQQSEDRGGEIGFQLGVTRHDEEVTGGSRETEPTIGLRGGAMFADHWGWFFDALYSEVDSTLQSDTLTARASIEYVFQPERRSRFFFSFGGGLLDVDPEGLPGEDAALVSLGFGQRIRVGGHKVFRWELRGDQSLDEDDFATNVTQAHLLFGLNWSAGAGGRSKDADDDGVPDRRDRCPDTPRRAFVDEDGCPTDEDGDGVWDGIDACAGTPRGWPVDARGCPLDTDRDGVPDGEDDCPGTPRRAVVDDRGCPLDTDRDGVPDGIDRCPGTPRGVEVDTRGCPFDSDGDGVTDEQDRCPGTPRGTAVGADGCPKTAPLFTEEQKTLVLEGVFFELNSDQLTPESLGVLDRVARSLVDWPDVRVLIAGHTDSSGDESYNLDLSTRRAEAVRGYLLGRKVGGSRMQVRGYGEAQPVASNAAPSGRARNRRVELTRVD